MWGYVLGLLFVTAAIAEDVANATSESSEEVKEADNVDNPLNESRRFSSDDISVNTQVHSLHIPTPPRNYVQISSPEPNPHYSPLSTPVINGQASNVPPRNILQQPSVFYPTRPNLQFQTIKDPNLHYSPLSTPVINGQANNVPPRNILQDPNLHYSPLPTSVINGQANNVPPRNILQQPSVFYPTRPNLHDQTIKNPNLHYSSLPSPLINGQANNVPPRNRLQESSLQYVTPLPLVPENYEIGIRPPPPRNVLQQNILNLPGSTQEITCSGHTEHLYRVWSILRTLLESGSTSPYISQIKEALMLLNNYLNELNPGKLNNEFITTLEKEVEKRVNFQLPTSPIDIPFRPNVNVPPFNLGDLVGRIRNFSPKCKKSLLKLIELTQAAFDYIVKSPDCQENHDQNYDQNLYNTGTNYLNHLLGVLNQKPIGNPDSNTLLSSQLNPSIVANPNQLHSYSIHSSVKSGSQFKNPEISLPTHVLPWYNFQSPLPPSPPFPQQPPSSITLTKENLLSPQVPNKGGLLNGYTNYFQNNKQLTFPNNVHQQINLNTHSGSFSMPPNSSPIDQQTLWATLQNMSSNPTYRQNIQKYISSQTVQQQSGHYVNVNPPVNHYIPPQTDVGNHGFDSNVQPGSSQHYGSYHQFDTTSTPYMNNPYLPITGNPTGHNIHVVNQNSYQEIGSTGTGTSTIDWYNIVNNSNLSPNYTPNGEVELTFMIRRTDENQPLYEFKYRITYDVFIENVRGLLNRRSSETDIVKGLVSSSNASEVPKELASYSQEELTQMVLEEGVLTKARYIDDSDNDTSSSAANSINELLNKSINKNVDDIATRDDLTRS